MGSAITAITFPYFFIDEERYKITFAWESCSVLLQITCSVKNRIKNYIFNLLTLFIFTWETNIRTTPDNSSYITVIPQYAVGKHYNAVNREFLRFGDANCFYFQNYSSFVTK